MINSLVIPEQHNSRSQAATADHERIVSAIEALKRERHAVVLAHNYQDGAIQDIADFVGDSLKLARYATTIDASTLVFCGVHFMAETAALLCPDKTVLMPDLLAGCSLADMVTANQVRHWKESHPHAVVVCYVNTSAAVKAECDYCCTSSNAIQVVEHIPQDTEILFVPDFYLGSYVKQRTGRDMHIWKGYCPTHVAITPASIDRMREAYPDAEFLMHPECGCMTKSMDLADAILSTDAMVSHAKASSAREFIIATDVGILHRLRRENPNKTFIPATDAASCHHMRRNTLGGVLQSLVHNQHQVTVPADIAVRAVRPIQRMLAVPV